MGALYHGHERSGKRRSSCLLHVRQNQVASKT
jgi:hypothetical protein